MLASRNGNAANPFWEWHERFLIALFPTVHMDDCLLSLCGENVRRAHGQTIGCCGALLES